MINSAFFMAAVLGVCQLTRCASFKLLVELNDSNFLNVTNLPHNAGGYLVAFYGEAKC